MLSLRRGEEIQIAGIDSVRLSSSDRLEYLLHLKDGQIGWLSASDLRTQRGRMNTADGKQVDAWQRDIDRYVNVTNHRRLASPLNVQRTHASGSTTTRRSNQNTKVSSTYRVRLYIYIYIHLCIYVIYLGSLQLNRAFR